MVREVLLHPPHVFLSHALESRHVVSKVCYSNNVCKALPLQLQRAPQPHPTKPTPVSTCRTSATSWEQLCCCCWGGYLAQYSRYLCSFAKFATGYIHWADWHEKKKRRKLNALPAIASGSSLPAQAQRARKTRLFLVQHDLPCTKIKDVPA